MSDKRPSIAKFEAQVANGERQEALKTAVEIVLKINDGYGSLKVLDIDDIVAGNSVQDIPIVFCTRFAAAFGALLVDPELEIKPLAYEVLVGLHRWIDIIFTLSGFRSSDHFLRRLGEAKGGGQIGLKGGNFSRFLAMLALNSPAGVHMDFNQFWQADRVAAAPAFMSYIRTRYVFRPNAFAFRERLLEWLPQHLSEVTLGSASLSRIQDIYMHCSYAITPKKHAIKAEIMKQMRRAALQAGVVEREQGATMSLSGKPTIAVVCEHIAVDHSIYRTHSLGIRALRERFNVLGFVYSEQIGPEVEDLFDETIAIADGAFFDVVRKTAEEIAERAPALIYYPSVGMNPHIIALASLRLAPVQCASYGHAASTMSPAIDYMVLPEDFAGSPDRFSEKLLPLPAHAMPFRPRGHKRPVPKGAADRKSDGLVRIGIPSSVMKLNPNFFEALRKIDVVSKNAVEYRFMPLGAVGIAHLALSNVVKSLLPSSKVFRQQAFDDYIERLGQCDFILCPFPYGNTNSIVDAIMVGLPGICLDGPEPHSHIDAGLFQRIGFSKRLIAQTVEDYVSEAVRLIDDENWRIECRKIAAGCDLEMAFYGKEAHLFCEALEKLVRPAR